MSVSTVLLELLLVLADPSAGALLVEGIMTTLMPGSEVTLLDTVIVFDVGAAGIGAAGDECALRLSDFLRLILSVFTDGGGC